jgi:DNA-directed RNA polymerase specialized sigma24 family protein
MGSAWVDFDPRRFMVSRNPILPLCARSSGSRCVFHVGSFCQEIDDLVQETLVRFVNAANGGAIHNPERYGAFLKGICNNVIREWRRARREPAYDALLHGEPSVKRGR